MANVAESRHPTTTVTPYQYWARVVRVVDGDTFDMAIEVGFEISLNARVRLRGVDTPEMFGVSHDSPTYARGVAARDFVESHLPVDSWVEIRTYKSANREKYGRWLCDVHVDGCDLADMLVAANLATIIA